MTRGSEPADSPPCANCDHTHIRHSAMTGNRCTVYVSPTSVCDCPGFKAKTAQTSAPVGNRRVVSAYCSVCLHPMVEHYEGNRRGCSAVEAGKGTCFCVGYQNDAAPRSDSTWVRMPDFSGMTVEAAWAWFRAQECNGVKGAGAMAGWLNRLAKMQSAWHQAELYHGEIRRALDK